MVFHPTDPAGPKPSGTVRADGSFILSTYPYGDGAPAGEYKVLVTWYPPNAREITNPKNLLPARYENTTLTPLTATVKEGSTELETFKLTK